MHLSRPGGSQRNKASRRVLEHQKIAAQLKVCGKTWNPHRRCLNDILSGVLICSRGAKALAAADDASTQDSRSAKSVAEFTLSTPYGQGDDEDEEDSLFCEPLNTCSADMVSPSPAPSTPPNVEGVDNSRIQDLFYSPEENETSIQPKPDGTAPESCSMASTLSKLPKICPPFQTSDKGSRLQEDQSSPGRATQAQMDPPSTPVAQPNKAQEGLTPPACAVNKQQSWTPARESFERRRMANMRGTCSPLKSPRPSQTRH